MKRLSELHRDYEQPLPESRIGSTTMPPKKTADRMTSDVDLLASRLNGDWRALLRARVNVLVTGPKRALDDFMNACRGELRSPLAVASPREPLPVHAAKTLVISDVQLLNEVAQRSLAAWARDPGNVETQIMSLTSSPLFALVNAGRFDRDLYYRLNTIHLKLNEATSMLVKRPRVA